ncbi:MAG: hypothetical protein ABW217_20630 [Polyangiaceae bacterium]
MGRFRTSLPLRALWFALLSLTATGGAAADEVGSTPRPAPLRVWYRSSDGCPDGARFIERLRQLGRTALLASVGDRVDFVVTLARDAEQSRGRLERQSQERTVAIRDVESASCEDVADALALSLELSLQPGAPGAAEPAPPDASEPAALAADDLPASPRGEAGGWNVWLGAQGRFETGLARALLPGAALFVELAPDVPGPSVRLSLRAARAVRDRDPELALTVVAARPEACMYWGSAMLHGGPCAGVDLGLLFARTSGVQGDDDSGAWTSAIGLVRGHWQVGRVVAVEAQIGAIVPFVRYRFDTRSGSEVADSAALGVEAALGVSFLL